MATPIVYDVNVLVDAAPEPGKSPLDWPSLPPRTRNPAADAIGAINDRRDFSLWLSPHIIDNTRRVLAKYELDAEEIEDYVNVLQEIAYGSGGGVVDPPRTVHVNQDHEDNLILDLAAHVDAVMIVSNDHHLVDMPLWRGTPVLRPKDFAARADAAWRNAGPAPAESTTDLIRRRTEKAAAENLNLHHAGVAVTPATDADYRRLRAEFDANRQRLAEIVGGWNTNSDAMKPRIAQWEKNLAIAATKGFDADALATGDPWTAHLALTPVNEKLIEALDRMDVFRETSRNAAKQARRRISAEIADDERRNSSTTPEFGG